MGLDLQEVQQPQPGLVRDLVEPEEQALAEVRDQLEERDAGVARAQVGPLRHVDRDPGAQLVAQLL